MSFAVIAFLIGGLTINANAQSVKKAAAKEKKETVSPKKEKSTTKADWDKTIKEYEQAVETCLNLYQAMNQKESKGVKVDVKEFNASLTTAETLKTKIEKGKKELTRVQTSRFNTATQKLSKVYEKQ